MGDLVLSLVPLTSHRHSLLLILPRAPALPSRLILFPVPRHVHQSSGRCHWAGPPIAPICSPLSIRSPHHITPLCAMSAGPPPMVCVFPLSARSPRSPCSPLILFLSSLLAQPPRPCSNWWCVLACVGRLSLFLPHLTSLSHFSSPRLLNPPPIGTALPAAAVRPAFALSHSAPTPPARSGAAYELVALRIAVLAAWSRSALQA